MVFVAPVITAFAIYLFVYIWIVHPTQMWVIDDGRVIRLRDPSYRFCSRVSEYLFAPAYFVDFMCRPSFWLESDGDRLLGESNEHQKYVTVLRAVANFGGNGHWTTEFVIIDLSDTDVCDDDLSEFKNIEPIDYMNLRNTHVTDLGLVHVASLKGLRFIDVRGTSVSAETARMLETSFPGLIVEAPCRGAK